VIWEPIYGISSIIKTVTAIKYVVTGIVIWFVLPFFLRLPSPSMLESKNQDLQISLVESKKMAALGGLVVGVEHEINTPLGVILTAASNLEELTE
jgi:signal transduction histidine kinase